MEQSLFKKHSNSQNFDEIFCFGMTRLRNADFRVFIQFQYTRTILRNKYIGQSLFKKHSKFQKFNEILYCGMTRFRNVELSVFRKYQNTETILEKKNMGENRFKKLSKFQKFRLSNFTLTWSIDGKINNVRLDLTYSK